jgi:NitT/TauT family transport system substrate-binding protein
MPEVTRRRVLAGLSMAGVTSLIRTPLALAGEGPPETTSVRFMRTPSLCHAPQFVAEELLRVEGFTDIQYIEGKSSAEINEAVASGRVDFNTHFAPQWVSVIDGGGPVTVLSGVHVGCFELFGKQGIRSIADLKGKSVGIAARGSSDHLFLSVMAAHIGLDPVNEINWITSESPTPAELFADGKIDACLGLPPVPQELRARNIGRIVVNSAMDRPWSEYFCCLLAGNREFVRKYPVATKRVVRAVLKAVDFCASDPERAANRLVDGGFIGSYEYALQIMRDVPYSY